MVTIWLGDILLTYEPEITANEQVPKAPQDICD